MAEENKHPPTTEEQAPPEMPGKAPKMEQAEIPDVVFFVKHFSLKKASEFPVFSEGFSLL